MKKDFERWHKKKAEVDEVARPFFHEREIWFCYLGANVGFEQDGSGEDFLRPILIVRKFSNNVFWGIPLTKTFKKRKKSVERFYFDFSFVQGIQSVAILSQLRLIDARRLSRHIGTISEEEFRRLTEKLKALLP